MDTGFRRGTPSSPRHPLRRPGESRGLEERCPLDSGFRRNDEGGRTWVGGRGGMTRKYRYDRENLPYETFLRIFPLHVRRGCGLTVEARLR